MSIFIRRAGFLADPPAIRDSTDPDIPKSRSIGVPERFVKALHERIICCERVDHGFG